MFEGLRRIIHLETLFLPIYVYALSKLVFKISENDNVSKRLVYLILRLVLVLSLIPIMCIILLLFALLTDAINSIAKVYYRKQYVNIASANDAMYSSDCRLGKGVIPAVYYIEDKSNTANLLMAHLKRGTLKVQRNHPRLQCIREQFLGYMFFLKPKHAPALDDIIHYFEDYRSNDDFETILNKKIGSPLPLDNKFLWDITLGRNAVIKQGRMCIPVLFRLHHSLGDGVTLMTLLITNYCDHGCETIKMLCDDLKQLGSQHNQENVVPERKFNVFEDLSKAFYKFVIWFWNTEFCFAFDLIRDPERFLWHEAPNNNIALLALEPNDHLLEKVKAIKRKLKVSFNDVLLGAISGSFAKYFIENNKLCPPRIVSLNPYNLNANNFTDLLHFNAKHEPITYLGNKFVIAIISLPINDGNLQDPKQFILDQFKITCNLKRSIEFQYMSWLIHNLSNLPLSLIMQLQNLYHPSTLVSNMPPLKAIRIMDHDIVDMTLSSVHISSISTCISIFSYKNMFKVSTMFDEACINDNQQKRFNENIVNFIEQVYEDL